MFNSIVQSGKIKKVKYNKSEKKLTISVDKKNTDMREINEVISQLEKYFPYMEITIDFEDKLDIDELNSNTTEEKSTNLYSDKQNQNSLNENYDINPFDDEFILNNYSEYVESSDGSDYNQNHIDTSNFDEDDVEKYKIALKASVSIESGVEKAEKNKSYNYSMSFDKKRGRIKKPKGELPPHIIYKGEITAEPIAINSCTDENAYVCYEGEVFSFDSKAISTGSIIYSFLIADESGTMKCKKFVQPEELENLERLSKSQYAKVSGILKYDRFDNSLVLQIDAINLADEPAKRMDTYDEKRVELHLSSNFSALESIIRLEDLEKRLNQWGHKRVAIADKYVVQAYPHIMEIKSKIPHMIYAMEGIVFDDEKLIDNCDYIYNLEDEFVVFDIETTGLSPRSAAFIEISALKVKNFEIVDEFYSLVNPQRLISSFTTNLTGVTNDMVKDAPLVDEMLRNFVKFVGNATLVAHNSDFDTSFIDYYCRIYGIEYKSNHIDTLMLSRMLLKDLKSHRLNKVAEYLNISLLNHHSAKADTRATAEIFIAFLNMLKSKDIKDSKDIKKLAQCELESKHLSRYNVLILVKSQEGFKNLYKLVSESHIAHYFRNPMIPKSMIHTHREGLLIGACGERGELVDAYSSGYSDEQLVELIDKYDFVEIIPADIYEDSFKDGARYENTQFVEDMNAKIFELTKKVDKLCIASSIPHYIDKSDKIYIDIIALAQNKVENAYRYFRTTDEMLDDFDYLGKDNAKNVVITNTNLIADMVETDIIPIPDGKFPPHIDGADEELKELCYTTAKNQYGENLPTIVRDRLDRELNSIIGNGYGVLYLIAQKLVAKSIEDGYLVGSRGSVGSSFAATMAGITEVNPLVPHYYCRDCHISEFITDNSYACGVDLPDKICPNCSKSYIKDGHNIPFETFLGFKGNKEPDIDLNFAGVYQSTTHEYTKVLFGEKFVYKAGTVGKIADKTAFGYVKKYYEDMNLIDENHIYKINPKFNIENMSRKLLDVKRTTGQHPGGIMVVPSNKEIYDFTPIQYPANDKSTGVLTTHFDYHSISGRILKLDLLGHDIPSQLNYLEKLTNFNPIEIPMDDEKALSLFSSVEALNIVDENFQEKLGVLGIPEFGTKFVRGMLTDIMPSRFSELVSISGLSHGTDVWRNNAQDLVKSGDVEFSQTICTRDDIMSYLISMNLPSESSFKIMESVRKGKGLSEEQEAMMIENNVPNWYIESCKKIKYMFPKAHAVAYVMMSIRMAYYKLYFPKEFYASLFSSKIDDFEGVTVIQGKKSIKSRMSELESLKKMAKKEENVYMLLEIANEMYCRGYKCHNVDLNKSLAKEFLITDDGILAPFASIAGIGVNAANSLVEARDEGEFISIKDIKNRSSINKVGIEALRMAGCLQGLPEDNQFSLDMFL